MEPPLDALRNTSQACRVRWIDQFAQNVRQGQDPGLSELTMHVLVIEDDALTAFMLEDMLKENGGTSFDFARTETRAIELAAERRPDLITADMRLAQGTGLAAVETIMRKMPVPVVLITGNPELIDSSLGYITLTKPVTDAALSSAVREAMAPRAA